MFTYYTTVYSHGHAEAVYFSAWRNTNRQFLKHIARLTGPVRATYILYVTFTRSS